MKDAGFEMAVNWLCGLVYIFPFIVIMQKQKSEILLFHLNQALNLWTLNFLLWVLYIVFLKYLSGALYSVFLVTLILLAYGLINGFNGYRRELPVIGRFRWLNDEEI